MQRYHALSRELLIDPYPSHRQIKRLLVFIKNQCLFKSGMFLGNYGFPMKYQMGCVCVCLHAHAHVHVQNRKRWARKSALKGSSPCTSSWSHSKWILRLEHHQRAKGGTDLPPIFKKIPQSSPCLCHPAETAGAWTSFYLSWPQTGRERMELSKLRGRFCPQ